MELFARVAGFLAKNSDSFAGGQLPDIVMAEEVASLHAFAATGNKSPKRSETWDRGEKFISFRSKSFPAFGLRAF